MAELKEYRKDYYTFSGKTSDIVRQLGFAGIALIWAFKYESNGQQVIPSALLLPGGLIVASLALDLLHYSVATAIWGTFHRWKEKKGIKETDQVKASPKLNWPALGFFVGKVVLMVAAYGYLLYFVIRRICAT